MPSQLETNLPAGKMGNELKNWVMTILTLVFVFLYLAALIGWLKPLADITMLTRLEPIIFVIIGYYFGRLPSTQNEQTLKDEIDRQTQKTNAAQNIKEQLQREREGLEEKIKSVRIALLSGNPEFSKSLTGVTSDSTVKSAGSGALHYSITTAIRIIDA
jgi:hypothetical protein